MMNFKPKKMKIEKHLTQGEKILKMLLLKAIEMTLIQIIESSVILKRNLAVSRTRWSNLGPVF